MICVKISEQLVIIVCPSGYTPDRGQIIVMVGPYRRLGGDSSQVEKKKWQINYDMNDHFSSDTKYYEYALSAMT